MDYHETSAKTGEGVDNMFRSLAESMLKRVEVKLNTSGEKTEPKKEKKICQIL